MAVSLTCETILRHRQCPQFCQVGIRLRQRSCIGSWVSLSGPSSVRTHKLHAASKPVCTTDAGTCESILIQVDAQQAPYAGQAAWQCT